MSAAVRWLDEAIPNGLTLDLKKGTPE